MFLGKARAISDQFVNAYNLETGLPNGYYSPITPDDSTVCLSTAMISSIEYEYLAHRTKETRIAERRDALIRWMRQAARKDGLYMDRVNGQTGGWESQVASFGSDSSADFFAGLVNGATQQPKHRTDLVELYQNGLAAAERHQLLATSPSGKFYIRDFDTEVRRHEDYMDSWCASLVTSFAMGAHQHRVTQGQLLYGRVYGGERSSKLYTAYQQLFYAKELANTLHYASTMTRTGLVPHRMYFNPWDDATNSTDQHKYTYSCFQLAHAYLHLWRLSHEDRYREWAWQLAQSIYKHCRCPQTGGYADIKDVNQIPTVKKDLQLPMILSATFKYLYLIFQDDDTLLSIDQWVFTWSGQPLPIRGRNPNWTN